MSSINATGLHPNYIRSNSYLTSSINSLSKFLRTGTLQINGIIIHINSRDSLDCIARKINAVSNKTGVTAKVGGYKDGYKLVLQSKQAVINITDKEGVLLSLYKNKLLGINNKCLNTGNKTYSWQRK